MSPGILILGFQEGAGFYFMKAVGTSASQPIKNQRYRGKAGNLLMDPGSTPEDFLSGAYFGKLIARRRLLLRCRKDARRQLTHDRVGITHPCY